MITEPDENYDIVDPDENITKKSVDSATIKYQLTKVKIPNHLQRKYKNWTFPPKMEYSYKSWEDVPLLDQITKASISWNAPPKNPFAGKNFKFSRLFFKWREIQNSNFFSDQQKVIQVLTQNEKPEKYSCPSRIEDQLEIPHKL